MLVQCRSALSAAAPAHVYCRDVSAAVVAQTDQAWRAELSLTHCIGPSASALSGAGYFLALSLQRSF
jgi:hypothetical protein